jgi:hypothetical protein
VIENPGAELESATEGGAIADFAEHQPAATFGKSQMKEEFAALRKGFLGVKADAVFGNIDQLGRYGCARALTEGLEAEAELDFTAGMAALFRGGVDIQFAQDGQQPMPFLDRQGRVLHSLHLPGAPARRPEAIS